MSRVAQCGSGFTCCRRFGGPDRSKYILQRVIVPQLVELDIFLAAFERGMAGELLEPGDVDALCDPARDCAAAQAVPGEGGAVEPGAAGPFLDDEGDRIGVDRVGTNPVAVGYLISPGAPAHPRRRQAPQPPEQRPLDNLGQK